MTSRTPWPKALSLLLLGPTLAMVACGESGEGSSTATEASGTATPSEATATPTGDATPTVDPAFAEGCDTIVRPSDDDQDAVQSAFINAEVDSTVCLAEGTYTFYTELSLTTDGVTIRGAGRESTILDFSGQISGGNGILITSDGCTTESLQVQNTPGDGIRATDVVGITFRDTKVWWDGDASTDSGAYGLYPVGSESVLIEDCEVKGASDAGIYVGQSHHILVVDSEAYGNVAGIEIENSYDAEVTTCHAHDNTGGVLVFNLPDLPVKDGKHSKVHHNLIENNNTVNFAPEGNIVGIVPQGTGILIFATDENEFHDNTITGHMSTGLAVFFYSEELAGTYDDDEFDPYPERNYIHDNTFSNNGYDPQDTAALLQAAMNVSTGNAVGQTLPDIIWDGCVNGAVPEGTDTLNCFSGDTHADGEAAYLNMDLCNLYANYTTDIASTTCDYESLPNQEF